MRPLAWLLRPLVRLLIQSGVTFPVFADMIRGLFIDVALHDVLIAPGARTDSRVSLLTGIHRKEIRRQRMIEPTAEEPEIVTRSSAILGRWLGSANYIDAAHAPLALPRSGPAPSFEALVASVTRDVRARAVLDEWLSQGVVSIEEDRVRLNAAAFLPHQGQEAQIFFFSRNLHDHMAAASANLAGADPAPFLDRSVHYDKLSEPAALRLREVGRDVAQRMLLEINREALAIADADDAAHEAAEDGTAPERTRRVNIGVYVYEDVDEAPPVAGGNA